MTEKQIQKSVIKESIKGGALSGILASLCCVAPLVIVFFGLGTVSFALSISQYRPYFLGLGFLSMVLAIFLHLHKKNKTCDMNCLSVKGLKQEKNFIISIVISMIIIYTGTLYVLVPLISPAVYETMTRKTATQFPNTANNANKVNRSSNLRTLNLEINGMTCTSCASGLQNILQSLDGVIEAEIIYSEGTGKIVYDPNKISKEEIIKSEAFAGQYSAEIISDKLIN